MNNLMVLDFDTSMKTASALFESKYFSDVKSAQQALVKIFAGQELGLGPFASMTGIHIINGKPTLSANLIATLVKNDPRYDYQVTKATDEVCTLEWYEDKLHSGFSSFTIKEAQSAQLTGKSVWKQYPSDMLFARAVTRGARRFAPGIFGGAPVYTPEELGIDTDQDGNVIDGELIQPEPSKMPAERGKPEKALGGMPWPVQPKNNQSPPPEPEPYTHDDSNIDRPRPDNPIHIPAEVDTNDLLIGKVEQPPAPPRPEPNVGSTIGPLHGRALLEAKQSKIADARAALEESVKNGVTTLGEVGKCATMTGLYTSWIHFKNTLTPNDETGNEGYSFPDNFKTTQAQKITKDGALVVFDWAVARKVGG